MGALAWTMMGLALWHFTIFLPDRCWGGIIGAFLGSVFGAILFGLIIHGFNVPGRNDTDLVTVLEAVPGAMLGWLFFYWLGVRKEKQAAAVGGLAPE